MIEKWLKTHHTVSCFIQIIKKARLAYLICRYSIFKIKEGANDSIIIRYYIIISYINHFLCIINNQKMKTISSPLIHIDLW